MKNEHSNNIAQKESEYLYKSNYVKILLVAYALFAIAYITLKTNRSIEDFNVPDFINLVASVKIADFGTFLAGLFGPPTFILLISAGIQQQINLDLAKATANREMEKNRYDEVIRVNMASPYFGIVFDRNVHDTAENLVKNFSISIFNLGVECVIKQIIMRNELEGCGPILLFDYKLMGRGEKIEYSGYIPSPNRDRKVAGSEIIIDYYSVLTRKIVSRSLFIQPHQENGAIQAYHSYERT